MNRSGIAGVVIIAASIAAAAGQAPKPDPSKFLTQPLVKDLYTADPSAHVFNGKLFIYPSHDIDAGVPADDLGSHFAMRDYHVFSMDAVGGRSPTTASRSTSATSPGRAARCGHRTRRRKAASTTCIFR